MKLGNWLDACLPITSIVAFTSLVASTPAADAIRYILPDKIAGQSQAVVVDDQALLHTTQLLPLDAQGELLGGDSIEKQTDQVWSNLLSALSTGNSSLKHLVKLNVYTASDEVAGMVRSKLAKLTSENSPPAVSYVTTRLPHAKALVAIDAVAVTREKTSSKPVATYYSQELGGEVNVAHTSVLPRGEIVYISGQSAREDSLAQSTAGTLKGLLRTLEWLKLNRSHVVSVKAFLSPMNQVQAVQREVEIFFKGQAVPPISYVEWTYPGIEIEMIATAPNSEGKDGEAIRYLTPPWAKASPVFCRVTHIQGRKVFYTSGLYSEKAGDGSAQVQSIFSQLKQISTLAGSDLEHLAKATYYVSSDDASSKLNKLRPQYYNPERPPAASKAPVNAVGLLERSITIDIIGVAK